jgi:CheY-like chemotaxis protein
LANLSHEIRTPMNAVVGLTALALDEKVSPRAKDYLSQLERSGQALLGVINDILDFSKLEEGKLELEAVDFPVATLLKSVDAMARFRAEQKGLAFFLTCLPGVPPVLRGDGLRLQQVLVNLVSNAVKFTEAGRVEVFVKPLPHPGSPSREVRLRFEVRDTGIGIALADQGRLFQSFTQVDASTTRVYGGTGLGLAICRQLVLLMGGTLGVESIPEKGSLFWFEVVVGVGEGFQEQPKALLHLAGLRVLLAEDNKVNQLVAREILAKVGISPVVVSNGLQAVERVETQSFDIVLMDLQMPVMDGLEATRVIRRTRDAASLPILALTAHTFAQERETCVEAGMQDLVPKPVDPDELYQTLSRWRPGATRP